MTSPNSKRTLLIGSSLLALVLLGAKSDPRDFDFADRIGLVVMDDRGACLSIPNARLEPGTPLSLTWVHIGGDTSSPELVTGKVTAYSVRGCQNMTRMDGDSFYRIDLDLDEVPPGAIYFAVTTPPTSLLASNGEVRWDLDHDGILELFRVCTSSEGAHFTIWSGFPDEGRRRWHRYHYLGYELDPTCTNLDY